MPYSHTIRGQRFVFGSLAELLAKANERKSGDELAGIAASSEQERVAAKLALADLMLGEIADNPVIDPDQDDVSSLILQTHDREQFKPFRTKTVGEFREWLLAASDTSLKEVAWAITPEMAAAVAKLMANKELVAVAARIRNVTRLRNTMGQPGVLGIRLQPNHPSDDLAGILIAALDGLLLGCGDAVIGVNPATDSVDKVSSILRGLDRLITQFEIPTQGCCLAHITTQLSCLERGAPVDLLFQSIAGTQAANASFGITLEMLRDGQQRTRESHRQRPGPWLSEQVMYFETGQGSACQLKRIMASINSLSKPAPTAWPGRLIRSWSTVSLASSARSISLTKGRSFGPAWKTTSWASCLVCRWGWMSVTPTTPMPIRTRRTICSSSWLQQGAIISWACLVLMM